MRRFVALTCVALALAGCSSPFTRSHPATPVEAFCQRNREIPPTELLGRSTAVDNTQVAAVDLFYTGPAPAGLADERDTVASALADPHSDRSSRSPAMEAARRIQAWVSDPANCP